MTLAEINQWPQDRFVEQLGWVFEHSPWVAERAWELRPFDSLPALHEAMTRQVAMAIRDEQLALLSAHPDLGAKAKMSDASVGEQAGAGLDRLTRDEFERLHTLNTAYRERFGFPFLYAVKGSTKYAILQALEQRLHSAPDAEWQEALRQVFRIALFRLQDTVRESSSKEG